jgi:O-antigen/teichoic acid export membrane protein
MFDVDLLIKVLKYSYPLLIASLAGAVNEALDRVLLKHLLDASVGPMAQLGVYGANIKIAVLMTLYVQMFRYAAEPFFFSKSEERDARKLYADVMTFFLLPGLFIFLAVMLYIDYFKLFIGSDFREGIHIVPVVLMANLMMGVLFNLSMWYKLTDRTKVGAQLVLIGAALTILINVVFVPRFGYTASAWGHLVCYSVMVLISYVWSRKHYRIPYKLGRIAIYFGVTLGAYFLSSWIEGKATGIINIMKPLLIIGVLAIFVAGEWNTFRRYRITTDQHQ